MTSECDEKNKLQFDRNIKERKSSFGTCQAMPKVSTLKNEETLEIVFVVVMFVQLLKSLHEIIFTDDIRIHRRRVKIKINIASSKRQKARRVVNKPERILRLTKFECNHDFE